MLSNNMFEHSSKVQMLLFTFELSLLGEYDDVLLKRVCVLVRACECVLFGADVDADDVRKLSAYDVPNGGGGGAGSKRCAFELRRLFVDVLLRALFFACSYFKRNGQSTALALWLCARFASLQSKHVNVGFVLVLVCVVHAFVRCGPAHNIHTV